MKYERRRSCYAKFHLLCPTCYVFGKDTELETGANVKRFGGSTIDSAKAGIEALRRFLISIDMPKNFEELGAKEDDIPLLAHTLCYGNGRQGTFKGYVELDEEDCKNIYRLVL